MAKVLVLYYSMYGHVEQLARAIAEGANSINDCLVDIMRIPETIPEQTARNIGVKLDQEAPVASPDDLVNYDAIIFGTPTRFGNMAGQMRTFLDQTGRQWANGELVGKIGSVFTSTGTGGGNESTILTFWPTLAHHGMIIMGLPYAAAELNDITEVKGGSPYGAGTIAGADGSKSPNDKELSLCRFQGKFVAKYAKKIST